MHRHKLSRTAWVPLFTGLLILGAHSTLAAQSGHECDAGNDANCSDVEARTLDARGSGGHVFPLGHPFQQSPGAGLFRREPSLPGPQFDFGQVLRLGRNTERFTTDTLDLGPAVGGANKQLQTKTDSWP